jgi:hypothetical protein
MGEAKLSSSMEMFSKKDMEWLTFVEAIYKN